MTETLANGYSSESTQRELSNEYQHDRFWMVFQKSLHLCALDESTLSIGRVNTDKPRVELALHKYQVVYIYHNIPSQLLNQNLPSQFLTSMSKMYPVCLKFSLDPFSLFFGQEKVS